MTIQGLKPVDRFEATSRDIFHKFGVDLSIGNDFEEYRDILAEGRPDHIIGAPFDPKLHDLNETNAVWIVGRDDSGNVMHTQALKSLNLAGQTLGTYLRRSFREFPPSGLDIDLKRSRFRAGPSAKRISGTIVYHGEVWMGGPKGQFRGSGLSAILGRFAFLTAIQKWAPDYVIGFMPKQVAHKGFVERQGYMHAEPFALRWFIRGSQESLDGFLVYMSLEDLHFVLDMPDSEIQAMAA